MKKIFSVVVFCAVQACDILKGVKDDGFGSCECINEEDWLSEDETRCTPNHSELNEEKMDTEAK